MGQSVERNNRLLKDVLTDKADVWLGQSSTRGIVCSVITNYIVDYYTDLQYLQLLTIVGYQEIPTEAYMQGLDTLREYAISRRCRKIVTYTDNVRLLAAYKMYGFNTDYRFAELATLEA